MKPKILAVETVVDVETFCLNKEGEKMSLWQRVQLGRDSPDLRAGDIIRLCHSSPLGISPFSSDWIRVFEVENRGDKWIIRGQVVGRGAPPVLTLSVFFDTEEGNIFQIYEEKIFTSHREFEPPQELIIQRKSRSLN